VLRPLDILVVLKIQAINEVWKQGNHDFGGGSGDGYGDGTGFGGPIDEARKIEVQIRNGPPIPFSDLGNSLGISASQAYSAVQRSKEAALLRQDYSVRTSALLETLLAINHYIPAKRGGLARGIPTAHAALPLSELIQPNDEPVPVWSHPQGSLRGMICEPLYKTAPQAALADPILYEYLALIDALRIGRAREVNIAKTELQRRLQENK
jgi:hypothetical protein